MRINVKVRTLRRMLFSRTGIRRLGTLVAGTAFVLNAGVGLVAAQPTAGQSLRCPALYAIGVPGTGESSPDADPADDHGMLSSIFLPMLAAEPDQTDRAYVPYEAGFGGAVPGGPVPYAQSVTGGLQRLRSMAQSVADRCQSTRLAVVGYSQGAHIASLFAQEIGRGQSTIPADRIAGVALLADPTRYPGASLFPGAAGKLAPDPAPGTVAADLSALQAQPAPAAGGGIGPLRDLAPDFGALTGRVASFCIDGDLACDSPANTPILHLITNIAGQALLPLDDPLTALSSITDALAATVSKTATDVVDKDLHGLTPGSLVLSPDKSLSERLAEASDPRSTIDDPTAQSAAVRLATITLNTLTSIVGVVLSPEDVCQIGTIGANDPLAGLAALAAKMFAAMPKRSAAPRFTQVVTQAFNAIGRLVSDNLELVDTQVWSKYQDAVARHGAYAFTAVAADRPSVRFVSDWFIALSRALPAPAQPKPVVAQPDSVLASMPGQDVQEPAAESDAKRAPTHRNPQQPTDATTEVGTAARADKTRGHLRSESAKAQAKWLEASRNVVWALLLAETACLLYPARRRIVRTGWDTNFLG
ncbi:cutinase family protein [Nocardia sp. NPDC051321]|uniref:cutinase family protein n=1 Tax=Nocardia sp. NPDC051321 TaxID=3364323 RepID=UPI0037AAFC56